LLRRAEIGPRPPAVLTHGDLTLIPEHHEVTVDSKSLDVTHFEFGLLLTLLEQPGRVWTRQQLLHRLYGTEDPNVLERTIDVHVTRIRDKLEQAGARVQIETVRGVGYKLGLSQPT